jgi:hypothetical protein
MGLNPKQILTGKKNTYANYELGTWRTHDEQTHNPQVYNLHGCQCMLDAIDVGLFNGIFLMNFEK